MTWKGYFSKYLLQICTNTDDINNLLFVVRLTVRGLAPSAWPKALVKILTQNCSSLNSLFIQPIPTHTTLPLSLPHTPPALSSADITTHFSSHPATLGLYCHHSYLTRWHFSLFLGQASSTPPQMHSRAVLKEKFERGKNLIRTLQ